ncbi:putative adhesin [Serratia marcescens]|uniref:putative adhesin n=1 Tax=Serratia marcescens TaxID=615 RepID=UPI003B972BAD
MELTQSINGKRIIVRRCNLSPCRRVAVISHGRFLPFSSLKMGAHIPSGVTVNWYVRHGETISNHKVMALYERLLRNDSPVPIKDYSGRNTVKNYMLQADTAIGRVCIPRLGGHCDVILPVDTISTQQILDAIKTGELPYQEIHFLSCRALRLTLTGI